MLYNTMKRSKYSILHIRRTSRKDRHDCVTHTRTLLYSQSKVVGYSLGSVVAGAVHEQEARGVAFPVCGYLILLFVFILVLIFVF